MTGQKKADTLEVGTFLLQDNYRIEALIGTGGASKVYRATHVPLDETVAIKVLHSQMAGEEYFIEMMKNEIQNRVEHPAVVRYITFHRTQEHGGIFFLVMEYVPGPSLERLMKRGPVPAEDLLKAAAHLLLGLQKCHERGIFHLDISPDNIILRNGEVEQATLIDFGIAQEVGAEARTQFGLGVACKFEYAAPEQMSGQSGARSDFYALGATLLAAARGEAPVVSGDGVEVEIAKRRPLDTNGIANPLKELIDTLTAPDPIDRPGAAVDAIALIPQALRSSPASASTPAHQEQQSAHPSNDIRDDEPTDIDILDGLGQGKDRGNETRRAPPVEPTRKKRWWPWLALPVLAALALSFHPDVREALLGEQLELAEPYRLSATRPADGAGSISGNAPSAETLATIARVAEEGLGPDVQADLKAARGAPNDGWTPMVLSLIETLKMLDEGNFTLEDNAVTLKGIAPTPKSLDLASDTVKASGTRNGYTWNIDLELAPQFLAFPTVAGLLKRHEDCGPLSFVGRDDDFAPGETLSPTGKISDGEALDALRSSLDAIADGREVQLDGIEILNPPVCRMLNALPSQEDPALKLRYRSNASGDVLGDDFLERDDFAIVDLIAPGDLGGYFYVFLVDDDGQAFHLRPGPLESGREDNQLAQASLNSTGNREVAILFPLEEARKSIVRSPQIRLDMADSGEVMMLFALVVDTPLFSEIRFHADPGAPGAAETVDVLANDLAQALAGIESVDIAHRLIRVR